MRKIGIIVIVSVLVIALSSTALVFANYDDIAKEIFGSDAPAIPETPDLKVAYYTETEDYDENEKYEDPFVYTDWDAYFDYLKKNDPNYVSGGEVVDERPGDIVIITAIKEAAKAVNFKTLFDNATKIATDTEKVLEKDLKKHNDYVEENTTADWGLYWNDPQYVSYIPTLFLVWDTMYVSWLDNSYSDEEIMSALNTVLSINDGTNGKVVKNADNDYLITFDGVYRDENNKRHHSAVEIIAKADGESGRICMYENETLQDSGNVIYTIYEFVPLGNNAYVFQSSGERLYVIYDEENGVGDYAYIDLKEGAKFGPDDKIYDSGVTDPAAWVRERKDDASIIFTRKDSTLTIERPDKEDVVVDLSTQ